MGARGKTRKRRQNPWWWMGGVAAVLLVAWVGWAALRSEPVPVDTAGLVTTLVGKPAPVLEFPDTDGRIYTVPDGGRPTVLIFHMGLF